MTHKLLAVSWMPRVRQEITRRIWLPIHPPGQHTAPLGIARYASVALHCPGRRLDTQLHRPISWRTLCLCAVLVFGCAPEEAASDPPLRPLVYTENPDEVPMAPIEGYEMWFGDNDPTAYPDEPPVLRAAQGNQPPRSASQVDLSTPEALTRALFRALADDEAALLERLIITPREYASVAGTGAERAMEHVTELRQETRAVVRSFRGEHASEQRPDGLGGMLQLEPAEIGVLRAASGEPAGEGEVGVMVWETQLRMRLRSSEHIFSVRLPKLLRTDAGEWRLAEPPQLAGMLELFLDIGFQLSPTLLTFDHYPWPLNTGNYWTYQIRHVPREGNRPEVPVVEPELETFRDTVGSRDEFDGYALVRIRRTYSDPDRSAQTRWLLLTARHVYACHRECRRNIEDISWLLWHLSGETPELVLPLRTGMAWRSGGRSAVDREADLRTWSEPELAYVPAGRYETAVRITEERVAGSYNTYFSTGVGVVMTRIDSGTDYEYHELIEYRAIP